MFNISSPSPICLLNSIFAIQVFAYSVLQPLYSLQLSVCTQSLHIAKQKFILFIKVRLVFVGPQKDLYNRYHCVQIKINYNEASNITWNQCHYAYQYDEIKDSLVKHRTVIMLRLNQFFILELVRNTVLRSDKLILIGYCFKSSDVVQNTQIQQLASQLSHGYNGNKLLSIRYRYYNLNT